MATPITSWPFVDQATTDLQYSKLFRTLQRSGVVGVLGSSHLQGSAMGTALETYVAPGSAFVRGYFGETVTSTTMAHEDADSQSRIDRVILRLDFAQTLTQRMQLDIVKGIASSNPAPPGLTQQENGVWEEPLYRALIPGNATTIAPANITDERNFIGRQLGQWTTSRRPGSPDKYEMGFNETLGYWEWWDGDSWEKVWKGVTWSDIQNKPTTSTLDGRTITVSSATPTNATGQNGDIWLKYS